MSGTPEPLLSIDPASGREIYAPTGETVDLVVTVVATPLPADEDACAGAAAHTVPSDLRLGLLLALCVVGAGAGLARRFARPAAA